MAVVYQSIVFDDAGVQVSFYEEEDRDARGMKIQTVVMNPLDLRPEVEELFDSLTQLIAAWEGLRREVAVPRH